MHTYVYRNSDKIKSNQIRYAVHPNLTWSWIGAMHEGSVRPDAKEPMWWALNAGRFTFRGAESCSFRAKFNTQIIRLAVASGIRNCSRT